MLRGVLLAFTGLVCVPAASAQPAPPAVTIPAIPAGAVCAEDKTQLIERALEASRAASDAAQAATRVMLERQADIAARRIEPAALEAARAERERRNGELARAEAAFDAANRLPERDCRPPAARQAEAAPAPGAAAPRAALALTLTAPANCTSGQSCTLSVQIENRGEEAMVSPLLASIGLGLEGGRIAVTPDDWGCATAGANLTCASNGLTLQPGASTRIGVEWRLPERVRRPSTSVCARIVWPGRGADGVYRPEQVAAVQFALERAGFEAGPPEGRLTPRTLDAMRQLRQRVGLQGGTDIGPEFLTQLFGRNGTLSGDGEARDDFACATVAFDGSGAVSAAAAGAAGAACAAAAAAARPPAAAPRAQTQAQPPSPEALAARERARQQRAERRAREAERRRLAQQQQRRPRVVEEDVVVIRRGMQPRVIYGPGCPCYVYPDGTVVRHMAGPGFVIPRLW